MSGTDKMLVALGALEKSVLNAWHREIGNSVADVEQEDCDCPKLTFSMFSVNDFDFSDNEFEMIPEMLSTLANTVAAFPINLHLNPAMFIFGGGSESDQEYKVVRLENPTFIAVFAAVEAYYRELGCPETDKQFVEGLMRVREGGNKEDQTVFMGS